jgi:serine/threonine protein kinase
MVVVAVPFVLQLRVNAPATPKNVMTIKKNRAMHVQQSLGEGGHGSVWTVCKAGQQRACSGVVVKLFHTNSCLEWEIYGNNLVMEGLGHEHKAIIATNTCLRDDSTTVIQVKDKDETPVNALMYRRVKGLTMDGKQRRAQRNALPTYEAFLIVAKRLINVVHAFHECSALHNDIKPANIMLENGEPVLLDFGITVPLDPEMDVRKENTTELYMDLGTLCYRKSKKRKRCVDAFEACQTLRASWRSFPWRQLDELVRRKYDGCISYTEYANKRLLEDSFVAPRTRDIYAIGMSLLEISVATFGYLVHSVEPVVTECLRLGPEAHKTCSSVLEAADTKRRDSCPDVLLPLLS